MNHDTTICWYPIIGTTVSLINYSLISNMHFNKTASFSLLVRQLKQLSNHSENIKTHDSESRGQEEAGRTRRMSVLFTGNTAMNFVNALNKPP